MREEDDLELEELEEREEEEEEEEEEDRELELERDGEKDREDELERDGENEREGPGELDGENEREGLGELDGENEREGPGELDGENEREGPGERDGENELAGSRVLDGEKEGRAPLSAGVSGRWNGRTLAGPRAPPMIGASVLFGRCGSIVAPWWLSISVTPALASSGTMSMTRPDDWTVPRSTLRILPGRARIESNCLTGEVASWGL
ncbi:MAG: hypothetical protein JXR96_10755 [Deltaproteobacteria bacterium]|nr:hypothetical protein [Deltaproteobacteria bacterium]